jgi:DNA (cytosine-5)-methyltransferase 1
MTQLVLSLFPGIGMLDMAFEEEGFCVVRGPDLLWGGDIHRFHPPAMKFDGVIGGPPCQAFSRLRHIVEANGYTPAPDLTPEFERCVLEAQPKWFLMENVEASPIPRVKLYHTSVCVLRDTWVGGETNRLRKFTFGQLPPGSPLVVDTLALHRADPERAVLARGGGRSVPVAVGGSGKVKRTARGALKNLAVRSRAAFRDSCRLQGLPDDFDLPALTIKARLSAVGNGVPLAMGRAVARAVKRAAHIDLDRLFARSPA